MWRSVCAHAKRQSCPVCHTKFVSLSCFVISFGLPVRFCRLNPPPSTAQFDVYLFVLLCDSKSAVLILLLSLMSLIVWRTNWRTQNPLYLFVFFLCFFSSLEQISVFVKYHDRNLTQENKKKMKKQIERKKAMWTNRCLNRDVLHWQRSLDSFGMCVCSSL